jgi:diguanylate cyclase (GGDEF)-like protein/PAS domain S-box-containing protein
VNISIGLAVMSFLIVKTLYTQKMHAINDSTYFLVSIFFIIGAFFTMRALSPLIGGPVESVFTTSLTQTPIYLDSLALSTLCTCGFIILVNQRLNLENREAKENLELIFNTSPDAAMITRLDNGCFNAVNEGFTALTGFSRTDVIGKSTLAGTVWKDGANHQRLITMLGEKGYCENLEVDFQRKDGGAFIGLLSARLITLNGIPHMISVTRDISSRKRAEEEKLKADDWLRTLSVAIEQTPVTTVITDLAGNIVFVNPKFTDTTGYTSEEAIGQNPRILNIGTRPASDYEELWNSILSGQSWHGVFHNKKKNGDLYWESAVISPVKNKEGIITHFLAVKEDITERKYLQEELEKQATTDELTGVTNRRHFLELANKELKRTIRCNHPLSIVLIDLDHFKSINDTLGHAGGDQALMNFAKICLLNMREIDIFARFGGDEFVLMLPETNQNQAHTFVERMCQTLAAKPIDLGGKPVFITFSSGISSLEGREESLDALLSRADQALYQAKEAGRNCIVINPDS